jgi:hypothetical protein
MDKDIYNLLMEVAETEVLTEAKSSEQDRINLERALSITSVELAKITVKRRDDGLSSVIRRPLFRMYAPLTVSGALITKDMNIQLLLKSSKVETFILKFDDKKERMRAIFAILRSADESQLNAMSAAGAKTMTLPAQVLQIKHTESASYMYPIQLAVMEGAFEEICKECGAAPVDLVGKILGD